MLSGLALRFTTFVLVVVVAQVSTLLKFSVLLYVWALGLGVRFKVYNGITRVQHKISSEPTLSQKRAVFPAFSSREVTLGQMCKIGIHFIIYLLRMITSFVNPVQGGDKLAEQVVI